MENVDNDRGNNYKSNPNNSSGNVGIYRSGGNGYNFRSNGGNRGRFDNDWRGDIQIRNSLSLLV